MLSKLFKRSRKAFENKHAWPESAARPNNHNLPSYASLDSHIQRFLEIQEALGEIGTIFESVGDEMAWETNPSEQICQSFNKLRIPGFFAYHLAQEGISLLNVIAASVALVKKDIEASEKLKAVLSTIEESEPILRQTVYDMEPYKSMDAKEAIQLIAARTAERRASLKGSPSNASEG